MKKYISEFVGTFALTFFACGVAVCVGCDTPSGLVATAFAFGLVIVAMAYSIGNISGCHINPAVSLAMYMTGKLKVKELISYVVSQVFGALAGSVTLGLVLGSFEALGANSYGGALFNGNEVTMVSAIVVEINLTFFFVLTILGVTSKKEYSNVAGIVIGLALVLVHLLGIRLTGTSVNPARSIGPALLQWSEPIPFLQLWIFIIGPMAGGALAGLFYKFILAEKEKD